MLDFPCLSTSFSAPSLHLLGNYHLLLLNLPDSTNSVIMTKVQVRGRRSYLVVLLVISVTRGE